MAKSHVESRTRTLLVAFLVCAVCSVIVSSTSVFLEPRQRANRERDREEKILRIVHGHEGLADLLSGLSGVTLAAHVVDLATGDSADHLDPVSFDPRRAAIDPLLGIALPDNRDPAGIGHRSRFSVVYQVESERRIILVVLPVHGSGYASTMYGYLALGGDLNTVAGLTFFEHGETPGLGGEIEDPDWLESWIGKRVFDEAGKVRIEIVPDVVDLSSSDSIYQVDGLTGATRTCDGVTALLRYWLSDDGFGPYLERVRKSNEEMP